MAKLNFYKKKATDKVWWVDAINTKGVFIFSFDKKRVFNLFSDYPYKLTPAQRELFDKENPYWANFFKERK